MNLEESHSEDNEKLESMESAIQELQTRFDQMETRSNQWSKNIEGVNSNEFFFPKIILSNIQIG